jgi:mycothiol synthase
MVRSRLDDLPALEPLVAALPVGYGFRTYRPGDEAGWAALMNTGEMDTWDAAKVREWLTGRPYPQFDPDGLFVLTFRDGAGAPGAAEQIVGSACAWLLDPAERETGILHMVCVLPEHRGAGLSTLVCLAVLHRFRTRGYKRVLLNTGDWRLGAVKIYLKLGFQPLYRLPSHPQQWQEVVRALHWEAPLSPELDPTFVPERNP